MAAAAETLKDEAEGSESSGEERIEEERVRRALIAIAVPAFLLTTRDLRAEISVAETDATEDAALPS